MLGLLKHWLSSLVTTSTEKAEWNSNAGTFLKFLIMKMP